MRVESLMKKDPICIRGTASITDAIEVMKKNSIRHLPVVDTRNRLCGFLTLADLKQGMIPSMVAALSLEDLIIRDPVTARPDDDIEEVARIIYLRKIGGMPVVDGQGKCVGILTVIDILRAFIEMMGLLSEGARLDVNVGDDPDAFVRVSELIREHGGEIISVGMAAHRTDKKIYYFRFAAGREEKAEKALVDAGYEVMPIRA